MFVTAPSWEQSTNVLPWVWSHNGCHTHTVRHTGNKTGCLTCVSTRGCLDGEGSGLKDRDKELGKLHRDVLTVPVLCIMTCWGYDTLTITHTLFLTHTHTHTYSHTHCHTQSHSHTLSLTLTVTHKHRVTRSHTYIVSHRHTHTQDLQIYRDCAYSHGTPTDQPGLLY